MESVTCQRPWASEQAELIYARDVCSVMPRQAVPDYKIVLIERGSREFFYRRATATASAGDLVVIHPGEVSGSGPGAGGSSDVCILTISPALFHASDGGVANDRPFLRALISDAGLTADFLRLASVLSRPETPLAQQGELRAFSARLLRLRTPGCPLGRPLGAEHGPVERARAYLEAYYADPIPLDHLARTAGLHPAYFCRVFRSEVGMPPHAYQIGVRVAQARALLAAGHPPGQVAALTGFFDQAHFTHAFRRYAKMTPAAYARSVSGRSKSYKTGG